MKNNNYNFFRLSYRTVLPVIKTLLFGYLVTSCWSVLTEKSYKSEITIKNESEYTVEIALSFDISTQFACDDPYGKRAVIQPNSIDIIRKQSRCSSDPDRFFNYVIKGDTEVDGSLSLRTTESAVILCSDISCKID